MKNRLYKPYWAALRDGITKQRGYFAGLAGSNGAQPATIHRPDLPSVTGLCRWTGHGTIACICEPAFSPEDGFFDPRSIKVLEFPASALSEVEWHFGADADADE